jgi:hypothetical protein
MLFGLHFLELLLLDKTPHLGLDLDGSFVARVFGLGTNDESFSGVGREILFFFERGELSLINDLSQSSHVTK